MCSEIILLSFPCQIHHPSSAHLWRRRFSSFLSAAALQGMWLCRRLNRIEFQCLLPCPCASSLLCRARALEHRLGLCALAARSVLYSKACPLLSPLLQARLPSHLVQWLPPTTDSLSSAFVSRTVLSCITTLPTEKTPFLYILALKQARSGCDLGARAVQL